MCPRRAPVALRLAAVTPAALFVASCSPSPDAPAIPVPWQAAADGISADAIRGHMEFLADDRLQGRETGSEGYLEAARYMADHFQGYGMEPAGGDGTYFQEVEFRRSEIVEEESAFEVLVDGEVHELRQYVDYIYGTDKLREVGEVSAPLVFAGFGVSAPDLDHDDYADIDVRGKIVVLYGGAPPSFPHNERAHHSKSRTKQAAAGGRGAVGMLWMKTPEREASRPFTKSVENARLPGMAWIEADGSAVGVHPAIRISASLSPEAADLIFTGSPKPLERIREDVAEGRPGAFDLPASVTARRVCRHSTVFSPNVAAVLRGGDPDLSREYVVLSAHLDHLGVGDPVQGDRIRNGAYDNASGCAIMLEIARAFASLEKRPARSLLFLPVTGEEKGLLGSEHFSEYPTVPIESIVANVNLDMVTMLTPLNDVIAFGAEHSTLAEPLQRAGDHLGIGISPDPTPEEVIFVRSDQYSFVKKGVPALYVIPGAESGDPDIDGLALKKAWRSNIYHSPQDDMGQDINFGSGADMARLNFLLTAQVADDPQRPLWNAGDFFGELFDGPMAGE